MKMTKLATLFLTASLTLASGSVLAAETGSTDNNGDANAAAAAGQVAPDAKQNIAPNNVDNSQTPIPEARCCIRTVAALAP